LKRTNEQDSSGLRRLARTEFCLARALGKIPNKAEESEMMRVAMEHLEESMKLSHESMPEIFNSETLEGVDFLISFVDR
jgi:hypothetical protein